jgi:hypothetical protein
MSRIFDRDETHPTQTSKRIDNSDLYEEIGDLVIERAHAGDGYCEEIFSRAYKKFKESIK